MIQALLILKPDVFDVSIRIHPDDILKKSVTLPDCGGLLAELLDNSGVDIVEKGAINWMQQEIKSLYNQPHHLLPEPGYSVSRVERLVELFAGKYIQVFKLAGSDNFIDALRLKMKQIRTKYLESPDIAFCSIFHLSDSQESGEREVKLYF